MFLERLHQEIREKQGDRAIVDRLVRLRVNSHLHHDY